MTATLIFIILLVSANKSTETLASHSVTGSSSTSSLLSLINARRCNTFPSISIERLGINYHRDSRVLEYGVVGNPYELNHHPAVKLSIYEYGNEIYAQVVDLCQLTACPIQRDFSFQGAVQLDYYSAMKVPSLAWSFPDLDSSLRITLFDKSQLLSCVAGDISNGRSTLIPLISIITAVVALTLIVIGSLSQLLRGSNTVAAEPPKDVGVTKSPPSVLDAPSAARRGPQSSVSPLPTPSTQPQSYQVASDAASITSAGHTLSLRSGISGTSAWDNYPALSQMGQDLQAHSYLPIGSRPVTSYDPAAFHTYAHPGSNVLTYQSESNARANYFSSTPSAQAMPYPEMPNDPRNVSPHIDAYRPYEQAGFDMRGNNGRLSTVEEVNSLQHHAGNQPPPHVLASIPVRPIPTPTSGRGPPAEWMDPMTLFLHFQYISSSALLSLRYPPVYRAFAANFAWANFLLPFHAFKNVAQKMRRCDLGQDIRQISLFTPYNIPSVYSYRSAADELGIPAYAYIVGITEQDIFLVVFLVFLCACAAVFAVSAIVSSALQIGFIASSSAKKDIWKTRKAKWQGFASSNILRVMMLALGTLTTFAFNRWRQPCNSVGFYLLSSLTFLLVTITLGIVPILVLRVARRQDGMKLLFDPGSIYARRWRPIHGALREKRLFFVGLFPFIVLARSLIIAFGQGHGLPQLFAMTALDIVMSIVLIVRMPYNVPGCNRVHLMLQSTRVASDIFMVLFVDEFKFSGLARNISGLVIMALNSLVALIIFALTVIDLGRAWKKQSQSRTQSMQSDIKAAL